MRNTFGCRGFFSRAPKFCLSFFVLFLSFQHNFYFFLAFRTKQTAKDVFRSLGASRSNSSAACAKGGDATGLFSNTVSHLLLIGLIIVILRAALFLSAYLPRSALFSNPSNTRNMSGFATLMKKDPAVRFSPVHIHFGHSH